MERKRSLVFIYSTFPTIKDAKKIGEILVNEKLAACVNIFKLNSIFRWKGKIERTKEFGVFFKTLPEKEKAVRKRIKELHPYEVPCILSFKVKASKQFWEWVRGEI